MGSPKKSVLIVDDDRALRDLYHKQLEAAGFDVRLAEDGALGVSEAQTHHPDLVVLDVNMPDMTGYEALKKLRTFGEWGAHVPVVLLSNADPNDEENLQSIEKSSAAYYLEKADMNPQALIVKAKELLGV